MDVGIGFHTDTNWPKEDHEFEWDGYTIYAKKKRGDNLPAIFMTSESGKQEDCEGAWGILRRFLSALSYATGNEFREQIASGASTGIGLNLGVIDLIDTTPVDINTVSVPVNDEHAACLAFFREGRNNEFDSPFYSYLCYFKIFEQPGKQQTLQKINDLIQNAPQKVINRADEIRRQAGIGDITEYVYREGRCAIAHYSKQGDSMKNPDDSIDRRRIKDEIGFVKDLAKEYVKTFV